MDEGETDLQKLDIVSVDRKIPKTSKPEKKNSLANKFNIGTILIWGGLQIEKFSFSQECVGDH